MFGIPFSLTAVTGFISGAMRAAMNPVITFAFAAVMIMAVFSYLYSAKNTNMILHFLWTDEHRDNKGQDLRNDHKCKRRYDIRHKQLPSVHRK